MGSFGIGKICTLWEDMTSVEQEEWTHHNVTNPEAGKIARDAVWAAHELQHKAWLEDPNRDEEDIPTLKWPRFLEHNPHTVMVTHFRVTPIHPLETVKFEIALNKTAWDEI